MITFIVTIHIIVCVLLATIILMQSGRGGGLTEGFAAAESMFGAKTNDFLIRGTTILAALFISTSLSIAFLSAKKNKSLMSDRAVTERPEPKRFGTPVESMTSNAMLLLNQETQ